MRKIINLGLLVSLFCVFVITANAQKLKLPTFFNDNMVLQQDDSVAVWGQDKPNQKITVEGSWGEKSETISGKDGEWNLKLKTVKTHCLKQTLTILGSSKKIFSNVLLGEVWFCSGQSNMALTMNGGNVKGQFIENANDAYIHANEYSLLRLYNSPKISSDKLCNDIPNAKWLTSTSDNIKDFSALAYLYGRKLQETLKVPVGMIVSAWGGAGVEAFMNEKSMSRFKDYSIYDDIAVNREANHIPCGIYNGMIHPFERYTIKGFLWYQGENNRPNSKEYKVLFPAMIKQWRTEWGQGELPFYYVQIAPLSKTFQKGNSAYLREAQMQDLSIVPNSGMVTTNDIGSEFCIHPYKKQEVANRLILLALKNVYGYKHLIAQSPIYENYKVLKDEKKYKKYGEGGKVQIFFNYAEQGLTSYQKEINNFEMAGEDKVFYPAKVTIVNRTSSVIATCEKVLKPIAVRYCFKSWCVGNLFNVAGLPLSSFRTDNWIDSKDKWSFN